MAADMGQGAVVGNRPPQLHVLTGLRGLAAWYVVLFHMRSGLTDLLPEPLLAFIGKGYLAVDLFFMLSGFVLWLNYAPRIRSQGIGSAPRFLWRRLARIWPLHLVVLAAAAVFAMLLALTGRHDAKGYPFAQLPMHLLLVQNWGFTDALTWNHPAWSISTELAAYLLFPLLVLAVNWNRVALSSLIAALVTLSLVLNLIFTVNGYDLLGDDITQMGLIRCLLQFAMGTVICALWLRLRERRGAAASCIAVLLALAALHGWVLPRETLMVPLLFATGMLALALARGPWTRVLASGPLRYLGEISYSTYLVHFLAYRMFKLGFVGDDLQLSWPAAFGFLLLVLALSVALYHTVEKPAQRALNARAIQWRGRRAAV